MITWIRPSGSEITTNDSQASIDHAEANDWKAKDGKDPVAAVEAEATPEAEDAPETVEDTPDTQEPAASDEGEPDADIGDDTKPDEEASVDGDAEKSD